MARVCPTGNMIESQARVVEVGDDATDELNVLRPGPAVHELGGSVSLILTVFSVGPRDGWRSR